MINLFRKIRRQYASENNLPQYLRYAFGEIALIIIGIIIALQLDNWNSDRKQEAQFNDVLEQTYNVIHTDLQLKLTEMDQIGDQVRMIEEFLEAPDSVAPKKMIHKLFYIDLTPSENFRSEIKYYLSLMEYNPDNPQHVEIAKELTTYAENRLFDLTSDPTLSGALLTQALMEVGIARPQTIFGVTAYNDFVRTDTAFYSEADIRTCRELLHQDAFRTLLRSQHSNKSMRLRVLSNSIESARSILNLIESHHPEVQLRYEDLGIIGDALETDWYESVPMTKVHRDSAIWEIELPLAAGYVKFRSRNSWGENWGGKGFPEGRLMFFGENIHIPEEGLYHITLNLENYTYRFTRELP